MSDAKFTKGPWGVWGDWAIRDESGIIVGQFESVGYGPKSSDEMFANAYIMATAPEMYAEIEEEIEFLNEMLNKAEPRSNIGTAISFRIYALESLLAKARGESCEN